MKNFIIGCLVSLLVVFMVRQCQHKTDDVSITEHSALIQEQLKNVSKLVVTEGHFSEVLDYTKSKALLEKFNLFSVEKKALVVANADVTIAYDLSKIEYDIDAEEKVLRITKIPEAEVSIHPKLEYYDIQQHYFNPFEAKDYNAISTTVKQQIEKRVAASNLRKNAENRLLSELSKFFILTNSMGWTLEYNKAPISSLQDIKL